jgi:dihydrofolate reductase
VQQFLRAGLVDEMEIHVVPLLLGGGARLFENLDGGPAGYICTGLESSSAVAHYNYVRER